MPLKRKSGSSMVDVSTVKRRSGSSWVNVQTVKRRSGSSWVTVWTAYTAPTASVPSSVSGASSGTSSSGSVSASATCSVSNGQAPYTYAWQHVSGTTFTVSNGSSATATFSSTIGASPGVTTTQSGVYRCKVTDAKGTVVYSNNCTVKLSYTDTSSGSGGTL